MERFLISDTHFDDKNILKMERNQFKNINEMNEKIINNWNNTVTKNDLVYFLGDFTSSTNPERIKELFDSLSGRIIFILGNHDVFVKDLIKTQPTDFPNVTLYEYPIIVDSFWILSHEPMFVSLSAPYANIFGHVHLNPIYKTVSERHYCVTSERIDFTPLNFEIAKKEVYERAIL